MGNINQVNDLNEILNTSRSNFFLIYFIDDQLKDTFWNGNGFSGVNSHKCIEVKPVFKNQLKQEYEKALAHARDNDFQGTIAIMQSPVI